jgi:hypothetical protein
MSLNVTSSEILAMTATGYANELCENLLNTKKDAAFGYADKNSWKSNINCRQI